MPYRKRVDGDDGDDGDDGEKAVRIDSRRCSSLPYCADVLPQARITVSVCQILIRYGN
jgi:hypothetical protein